MIFHSTILKNEFKKTASNSAELNILRLIQMALVSIVIIWLNQGTFTYIAPYIPKYIIWGMYLAWFGLALTSNKKFAKIFCIQCWPLIFFCFYMVFISFFIEKDLEAYIKSILYLIMVYSIFLYYFDVKYRKFQKFLCAFLFLDCISVAIGTYIRLQMNPLLARYLSMGIEARENLLGSAIYSGIGAYGYFYSLVSIILLLGFLFLNYPKKKFLVLLIIIAFISLLIQGSFTIAIIFTFIFFTLLAIIRYTNKYTFIAIALLVVGVTMLLIFQGTVASMFGKLANSESIPHILNVKFSELSLFFSDKHVLGVNITSRTFRYLMSIDAFKNNMLTGTAFNNSNMYSAGGHSAWLDLLAYFGILSIPFFVFLFKAYKYCKNRVPLLFRPFFKVYWLYFICLGFVNTLFMVNIFVMWFLFLPLFISSFFEISEEKLLFRFYE